jgi:hypothetical protein
MAIPGFAFSPNWKTSDRAIMSLEDPLYRTEFAMRRRIAFMLMIVSLVSCKSTIGPFASKKRDQKPDPLLTTSEDKQRWGRDRYSYPEENSNLLPKTYTDTYGPTGR